MEIEKIAAVVTTAKRLIMLGVELVSLVEARKDLTTAELEAMYDKAETEARQAIADLRAKIAAV